MNAKLNMGAFDEIKKILIDAKCIVECDCGDYYWKTKDDESCYKIVFSKLKENGDPDIANEEVQNIVKDIISVAGGADDVCPHCGWKLSK